MDINLLRGIATIIVMASFLGICWWAYIYRTKESFQEAAELPFAEDRLAGKKNHSGDQPHD